VADITVDHDKVDKLGTSFDGWATDIGNAGKGVKDLKVQAGDFPDATTLVTTITTRAQELQDNLAKWQTALQDMGTALHNAAKDYNKTEGENAAEAEFTTLDTNLNSDLPGFDKGKSNK